MTGRVKGILSVVTLLFYLATLPIVGFAQTPQEDKTFHEQYMAAKTVQERITLVEQRIARIQKALDQARFDLDFLAGVAKAGLGTSEDELTQKGRELERTKDRLKQNLRDARKRLEGLKNMDAPEFSKAKAKSNVLMGFGQNYRTVSKAHREAREGKTKRPVSYHNLHMAVILTYLITMTAITLLGIINTAIALQLKATRGSEGGGSCFVAGTLVLMADGSFKPIEDIRVGDKVFSRDARSGEDVVAEVYKLMRGTETAVYRFDDGLQVNGDHRFYTDRGAVMAGNLKPGAVLLGLSGERTLCSIGKQGPALASADKDVVPSIPVYNIMVRGTHTFFVSPDGGNTYMVLDISACGNQ